MILKELKIVNFKNIAEKTFIFSEECTVFEGLNGVGKTSILESIHFLCTGKSYLKVKNKDLIRFTTDFFL